MTIQRIWAGDEWIWKVLHIECETCGKSVAGPIFFYNDEPITVLCPSCQREALREDYHIVVEFNSARRDVVVRHLESDGQRRQSARKNWWYMHETSNNE
jgi:endogenous inhibitor of DNA gyrase (YacG/DUF329 family)